MSVLDDFITDDTVCDAIGCNDGLTDTDCLVEQGWFDRDRSLFMDDDEY